MRGARWAVLGLVGAVGCAEAPFSPHARDNVVEDVQRALAASQPPAKGGKHATAYLVTTAPRHLVAYDMTDGKTLWDQAAEATSRVVVGRGFVAYRQGEGEIAVRAADSGTLRCTHPLKGGEKMLGMAADERVYYTAQSLSGTARETFLVALSPDNCAEQWRDEGALSMGAPAARGGVVAAPYGQQWLVFLDGKTGAELARVRATDEQVKFVRATSDGFFYGANSGVFLFDPKSAQGSKSGSSFAAAKMASDQIRTFYFYDAYDPAQAAYSAFDRNRLLWLAEPRGGTIGWKNDAAYLHSYRFFFSFDANTGAIKWAYAHPRIDVMGSEDVGPSIVFAAADGEIGALDAATGGLGWTKKTGVRVAGVTFDAEGFAPGGAGQPQPVSKTLSAIVWDNDARFTAVKVFAVDAMTRVPGKDVTEELVKIVQREGMAPQVTAKAADALVARKDGDSAPLYREALALHYDYLADKHPRGVDTLARVEAAVGDKDSAELLGRHLLDPATPLHALKEIVKSLLALGGKAAIKPLRDLVLTYRCDPSFLSDPASLEAAVDGLIAVGGPEERRLVTFVAEEPRTISPLQAYMHRALADTAPKPKAKPKAKPGEERPDAVAPPKK